jgi:hypothetical protein
MLILYGCDGQKSQGQQSEGVERTSLRFSFESQQSWHRKKQSWPITVALRSKAWTVFASSNTEIVGSNSASGMNVCVRLFCAFSYLHIQLFVTSQVSHKVASASKYKARIRKEIYRKCSTHSLFLPCRCFVRFTLRPFILTMNLSTTREATSCAASRESPSFYGTQRFITTFTRALLFSLSIARTRSTRVSEAKKNIYIFLGRRARPVSRVDNLTAFWEPNV